MNTYSQSKEKNEHIHKIKAKRKEDDKNEKEGLLRERLGMMPYNDE